MWKTFSMGKPGVEYWPEHHAADFPGRTQSCEPETFAGDLEESVAGYRQRVLVAFKEVQDALTGTRLFEQQAAAQDRMSSARTKPRNFQSRYREVS